MTPLTVLPLADTTVALREAVATDVEAIVALLADDQLGASRDGASDAAGWQPYLDAFAAIDADPAQLLVVADLDGAAVATVQLTVVPGLARRGATRGQLEAVRVRRDLRGTGLGAAMIGWVIEEARRRDCRMVQLTTDKTRTDAHRFYARLGFVASHEGFKLSLDG